MKYILVIGLVAISFLGGIYYENNRLVGEPDKTVAIMLSKQTIENSIYQINENTEYLEIIQKQEYTRLADKIRQNSNLLKEMNESAKSICSEVKCNDEQRAFILNAFN